MKALVFGEALWDVFPDGKELGGAPVNFAAHLSQLGSHASVLTGVGDDSLGRELVQVIGKLGVDTTFVSVLGDKPTGACNVILDNGEPSYELITDVAYDYISTSQDICEQEFDVLYFGTLAQRSAVSANTLSEVLGNCQLKEIFCDLNLRQNFYSAETILSCLQNATILKLNRSECNKLVNLRLAKPFDSHGQLCQELCDRFSINLIIITLDSEGALCYCRTERKMYRSQSVKEGKFLSAVGAGDGFSACFVHNYMNGKNIQQCIDRANALGAYIVSFHEAIPDYSDEIKKLIV